MAVVRPTWQVADFDCFIEYTLPSAQSIEDIMGDPEWIEAVGDQEEWVDVEKALVCLGFHTEYVFEGRVVDRTQ
jgi:hypothetical protein